MQNLFSNTLGNRYVDPKMRLANLLMKQGTDTSPIAHPMQGVSRLASTLAGLYGANQSKKDRGEALQAFARQQGPVADVEKITAPSDEALLNDPAVQALLGKYNEQQAVADDVSNVAVPATNAEDLYNAPSRKLEEFGDEKILNNLGRAIRGDGPQATDSIDDFKTASAMATADRMREPTEQFGEKDFMQLLNEVNSGEGPPQNWMRGQSGKLSSNLRNPVSPASIVPERVAPRPDYEQQMADKINQLRDQRTVKEMVPGKPQMSAMDFAIKNLTGLPDNPYAQERLANLLNTKMAVSEQDRLWNRNRGAEVEDREATEKFTTSEREAGQDFSAELFDAKRWNAMDLAEQKFGFDKRLEEIKQGNKSNFYISTSSQGNMMIDKRTGWAIMLGLDPTGNIKPIGNAFTVSGYSQGQPQIDANNLPKNLGGNLNPILSSSADPNLAGDKAYKTAVGKTQGEFDIEAQLGLPDTIANTEYHVSLLDKISSKDKSGKVTDHPGFGQYIGLGIPLLSKVPGTHTAGMETLVKQVQGKNFLQAFASLKGGGHITEIEGEKATDAFARLNHNQSEKDFREAIYELRGILQLGLDRARARAGNADINLSITPKTGRRSTDPLTKKEVQLLNQLRSEVGSQ